MDVTTSAGGDTDRLEGGDQPLTVTPGRLISLPHAESWTSWRVRREAGGDPSAGKTAPPPTQPRARSSLAVLVILLLAGLAIALPDKMMRQAHNDALPCAGTAKKLECRDQGTRPDQAAPGEARAMLAQYARPDRQRARPSPVTGGR